MTLLSVNVNKIALLRNSRGRDYPSVTGFVSRCLELGVRDVFEIAELLRERGEVEFNIEGYPSEQFLDLVLAVRPSQCTLVPDDPSQLTSDHGWDIAANRELLLQVTGRLREAGIRSSLFVDPQVEAVELVPAVNADRIELYTEEYAESFGTDRQGEVLDRYRQAAERAVQLGLGVNAGHDLNLDNLAEFLKIPAIQEVSIGHALIVEALQLGIETALERYLAITSAG
jgi:pyridoxine 5-phosphate synthase